jgi:hypothetical protein
LYIRLSYRNNLKQYIYEKQFKTIQKVLVVALFLSISITGFYACKKSLYGSKLNPLILEFVKSEDFKSQNSLFNLDIDEDKSRVLYYNNDYNKPEIHVVLKKNNKIVAIIDAIKNTNVNIELPNNGKYFMLHRDLSNFDLVKLDGEIKLVDLNYDNHVFNLLTYSKGANNRALVYPVPQRVLNKYADIISKNHKYFVAKKLLIQAREQDGRGYVNQKIMFASTSKVPCDLNRNGNLSFSECFMCMNGACQTNSDCYLLCYGIGDVIGWVGFRFPHCQASIGTACIWLSIEY